MLLFRSEEDIESWLQETGERRGEVLTLQQVWDFSLAWYSDRMDPGFRGRSVDDVMAIFNNLGMRSPFWRKHSHAGIR